MSFKHCAFLSHGWKMCLNCICKEGLCSKHYNYRKGRLNVGKDITTIYDIPQHKLANLYERNKFTITEQKEEKKINNYETILQNNKHVIECINECKKVGMTKFNKKSVLYMFVLANVVGCSKLLCKIGYSSNIQQRKKDLEKSYGCKLHLIGVRRIIRVEGEKQFHAKHKNMHVNIIINGVNRREIYPLDETIEKAFWEFKEVVE